MDRKKLILVDGYSFFFRAYFALKNIKKRSDGLAVNGVYGFTRMLINLIIDLKSTHIAIVFDTGKKTFRNKIFTDYKANRPPVPDDMIPQFPLIREVAEVLNIKVVEKEGYEADDIIATLAKQAEKEKYEVWIISSDKDLMQLVNENIFLYETKENKKIGIEEVKNKWGVEPSKLLDVLSLMGDNADNVPGVPSIGEKTAVELINTYGNIDNLIKNIDSIKQEKRRNTIKENLDKLFLSKKLITLVDSVDLNIHINELLFKNFDPKKLVDFLYKMEFNSIAKEIEKVFNENNENNLFSKHNNRYKKITDLETLNSVCNDIKKNNNSITIEILNNQTNDNTNIKYLTFNDKFKDLVFYVCIANEFFYYDLFNNNQQNDCLNIETVLKIMQPILENENIVKISYNIKKQLRLLKQFKVDINNYDDLSVIFYLFDNGKYQQTLSNIIERYLYDNTELKIKNIEKVVEILNQLDNGKDLSNIIDNQFDFCCKKIDILDQLYSVIYNKFKEEKDLFNLYNNIENPLIKILADMEFNGIKVDINELSNLSNFFSNEINRIETKIYKEVGVEFNINSPKQLSEILFTKMNLPKIKKINKSGIHPTNVEILENLYQMGFDIAGNILEYRHYVKLKNTYTDTLQKLIDKNLRVHTTYSNTYVITGRLSSNNPNLQNIPIRTEDGEKIRKTFVSKNGYSFIGADYSQIELRILAEYANVKRLLDNFNNNLDIHNETAKQVFQTENIDQNMRRMAKAINFSIIYGTTAYGLAKRLDMTNSDAKSYMENYFNLYPEVKKYMEDTKEFIKKNGFVKTMFGRICYIDLANSREPQKSFMERLAINAPIQGTGADLIKMAMIEIYKKIKDYDAKIVLQIHDELLIEVKDEQVNKVKTIVKETMENIIKFKINLPVEIKIGKNWGEAH